MKKLIAIILSLALSLFCSVAWGGINFTDSDDTANCGNDSSLNITTENLTIAFWMKSDSTTGEHVPISRGLFGGDGYFVEENRNNDSIQFIIVAGGNFAETAAGSVTEGVWIHVVCIRDSTNPLKIYLDGSETVYVKQDNGVNIPSSTRNFYIGRYDASGFGFIGKLSEVAVWAAALSELEVGLLYNSKVKGMPLQIQSSSLLGYWPLDDVANGAGIAGETFVNRANPGTVDGSGVDVDADSFGSAEEVLSYP